MFEAALFCLALNLFHEARGEPIEGQRMVAYVTMNRAGWKKADVCPTVFAPSQFSWANGKVQKMKWGWAIHASLRPGDKAAWIAAQSLARTVLTIGRPPERRTKGATFYHATHVRPYWAKQFTRVASVGNHIFYRR